MLIRYSHFFTIIGCEFNDVICKLLNPGAARCATARRGLSQISIREGKCELLLGCLRIRCEAVHVVNLLKQPVSWEQTCAQIVSYSGVYTFRCLLPG